MTPPRRPLRCHAAREILGAEPEGARREEAQYARRERHEVPDHADRVPVNPRIVAVVAGLRGDEHQAIDRVRVRCEPRNLSPRAVPDERDRSRAFQLIDGGRQIERAPIAHRAVEAAQGRGPRFADAAIVEGEDGEPSRDRRLRECIVVAALHAEGARDQNRVRAAFVERAAQREAVAGRELHFDTIATMTRKRRIIGTAGHIDHGKTSLVKALTGVDTDRLPEEKRRGITIDLGFASWFTDEYQIGFIDVPGHERFVKNMLAGVGGIDSALLVVAADESIKPQTREHFAICRLLEIPTGVVAITKSDLVDSDILDLVRLEVEELVAGSFLEGQPIVPCRSTTGAGLDDVKKVLLASVASVGGRDAPRGG